MPKKQNKKAPNSTLSDDDAILFRNAVRDIKPLLQDKTPLKNPQSNRKTGEVAHKKDEIFKPNQKKSFENQPSETPTDETQLFQDAVKDITRLQYDKITHTPKTTNRTAQQGNEDEYLVADTISDEAEVEKIQPTDILSYCQLGIQKRVFKKLRRGQYITIDELDLHGLNLKQAKSLLLHFLEIALQVEGSCVSIIHGKGHRSGDKEPVLKRQTNHWLQQHPRVLAFHSAQTKDGGTGAVYVLLRRTKLSE